MDGWTVGNRLHHQHHHHLHDLLHRQQMHRQEEQHHEQRQQSSSFLQSQHQQSSSSTTTTTRTRQLHLHHQNFQLLSSTNRLQDRFASIMSEDWGDEIRRPTPSLFSSGGDQQQQQTSQDDSTGGFGESGIITSSCSGSSGGLISSRSLLSGPTSLPFGDSSGARLSSNFRSLLSGSSSLDSELLAATQGFSLTSSSSSTTNALHAHQRQVFAASRSQTLQQSSTSTSTSSGGLSSSLAQATATASSAAFTQISASSSMGVTRSFSSSSGFPPSSSSTFFSSGSDGGRNSGSTDSALALPTSSSSTDLVPSLASFVSPFRRAPFNFRNFNRPLWTDMRDIKDNNRMTWDPAIMVKSSSQIQFSASQQTFLESSNINGECTFRAFKDQRVMLRQSYGASESESDNDDEDDDDEVKSLTYRQKPALPYQPRLAITHKPHNHVSYAPSEDSDTCSILAPSETDTESTVPSPRESGVVIEELPVTPEHKKCYKVAHELLTTERTYVRILHLIDQIFHFRVDQENRVQTMFPPEIITQMFCNIKSLYKLHNEHLLPQLEKRLENWEIQPRIGDIMKDFAPFLKMYSEYVQNFDNSLTLINLYREKNARFMNIISEVEKREECGNLPIQNHLIVPVQRIPRYRLLLEAYLRRLPEDSDDKADAEKALEIVSMAAEHANEAMRRIASFKKLLEVQEDVKGAVDLVSPTRTLMREGKITKISARTGDHQERYLFLFSDMILLCAIRPMANRMISPATYQLRAKLDVFTVSVAEGDDLVVENTFYVEDSNKKFELYTATPQEKEAWMTAIHNAKEELIERKSSLRLGSISPTEDELGMKEPTKLKSDSVSKCMECYLSFSMLKRKHHCHACGSVVCAKCSDSKLPLHYAGGKTCRVCKRCKTVLLERIAQQQQQANNNGGKGSAPLTPEGKEERMQGVLDVPGSVPALLNGTLSLRLRGKKEWTPRWFALRTDFVLYCYEKETDERAMTATPLPGMGAAMVEDLPKTEVPNVSSSERDRVFRLAHGHGRKSFVFLARNRTEALNWVQHLKQAAKAELPPPPSNNNVGSPIKTPTNNSNTTANNNPTAAPLNNQP